MDNPINANPTIINVEDLPTRLTDSSNSDELKSHSDVLAKLLSLSFNAAHEDAFNSLHKLENPEASSSEDDDDGNYEDNEDEGDERIDEQEIFDLISSISDPEHPLTLAQLAVVNLGDIHITHAHTKNDISEVLVKITPTITHCSLATLIGLGIRVRLERCLPSRFRIRILLKEGSHQSENQVNKQLNDKERVAAARENDQLLSVISQMLSSCK